MIYFKAPVLPTRLKSFIPFLIPRNGVLALKNNQLRGWRSPLAFAIHPISDYEMNKKIDLIPGSSVGRAGGC